MNTFRIALLTAVLYSAGAWMPVRAEVPSALQAVPLSDGMIVEFISELAMDRMSSVCNGYLQVSLRMMADCFAEVEGMKKQVKKLVQTAKSYEDAVKADDKELVESLRDKIQNFEKTEVDMLESFRKSKNMMSPMFPLRT